jgi:hypothetical protein
LAKLEKHINIPPILSSSRFLPSSHSQSSTLSTIMRLSTLLPFVPIMALLVSAAVPAEPLPKGVKLLPPLTETEMEAMRQTWEETMSKSKSKKEKRDGEGDAEGDAEGGAKGGTEGDVEGGRNGLEKPEVENKGLCWNWKRPCPGPAEGTLCSLFRASFLVAFWCLSLD